MASKKLLEGIASKIADYRKGEIDALDADHVDQWISQFDAGVRDPILKEMDHVLEQTYLTKSHVNKFLKELSSHKGLTNGEAKKFWKTTNILNIQSAGSSQEEMLQVLGTILQKEYGVDIEECPNDSAVAVYIDDVVFSGGHVRSDLVKWVEESAPKKVLLHIIVLGFHRLGQWYASKAIEQGAKVTGKSVDLRWWRIQEFEDRKAYINDSDVLRPVEIPNHQLSKDYAKALTDAGYPPILRKPGNVGPAKLFSNEEGRNIIEQQLLIKGTEIRKQSPYLNDYQRPLGNMVLRTFGFGALIVTFRNCANNCPLALWAEIHGIHSSTGRPIDEQPLGAAHLRTLRSCGLQENK
jgi:hypothetical protein